MSPAAILSVPLASVWLLTAGIMKRRTGMKEPGAPILETGYPTAPQVRLTLIQVYDAQNYFHDHRDDIEQELLENTEQHGRAYLLERLGEVGYLRVTGQGR